tara:strand:+ start:106 stop:1248 length:1143 start_codon:yes stop_codon:yes gene_type:complete
MKRYLNKYLYLFLGLIVLVSVGLFFIIPNFQTEEFDQDVIDNIIEGITTTSTTNFENELNENNTTPEAEEVNEEDLNITEEEFNKIEKLILNNTPEQEITGFDVYMLIGSDERTGKAIETRGIVKGKRADVIILGLINQDTNETTLLSFPRDLLIKNNCTDKYERINASYVKNNCGNNAENLAAAIYSISGLRVNHFASFDFLGFEKIIDSVGGVEICVEVTQREGFAFELQEGCQVVNGLTTLNWIVSRSTERLVGEKTIDTNGNDNSTWELIPGVSDLTRIERQQYVVVQLIKELRNFSSINELNSFINALEETFTIDENLSTNKAVDLLWNLRDFDLSSVKKITAPINYVELEDGRQVLILSQNLTDFLIKEKVIDG